VSWINPGAGERDGLRRLAGILVMVFVLDLDVDVGYD